MPTSQAKGVWISIDGAEGVGKSTLARNLLTTFGTTQFAPEFSSSVVGQYLRNAVLASPHLISESPAEQSLLFLADFFRVYDAIIYPALGNGELVISDRGLLSKYVYQLAVLTTKYSEDKARNAIDAIIGLLDPPSVTLLLTCDRTTQITRLVRRDGSCDASRVQFIQELNERYQSFLASRTLYCVTIEQDGQTSEETVLAKALQAIHDAVGDIP